MNPDSGPAFEKACDQFLARRRYSSHIQKIDNCGLHAGCPMYFYCKHCGVPTEVLPEDYLFPPLRECSQCRGLDSQGWLAGAVRRAEQEDV